MPDHAIDAVLEIFAWVGVGAGVLLGLIALVLYIADGSWFPARAMIEESDDGRVARWFDADGGVGAARLTPDQERELAGQDEADVFYRRASAGRMRLEKGSPVVRGIRLLSFGLLGVGVVALILSWIVLFARG